jgi:hypothetical protein
VTKEILGSFKLFAIALSLAIGLFTREGDDGTTGPIGDLANKEIMELQVLTANQDHL